MEMGRASRTALRVAMRRAAHQMIDRPLVFDDPMAVKLLAPLLAVDGHNYDLKRARHPVSKAFRSYLIARSRYAEEQLAEAVSGGGVQYVVLGAGLDTFAYRNPYPALHVYEVDFPATQSWKRQLLEQAEIAEPATIHFVPLDFEKMNLAEGLERAGFDFQRPAFFSWMGVTVYLTRTGFRATLDTISALPVGSAVSFDYSLAREALGPIEQRAFDRLSLRVAAAGEPFQLFFSEEQLEVELSQSGFSRWQLLGPAELNLRYFEGRTDGLKLVEGASRIATAWK